MSILGSPKDAQFIGLGYSFIDTAYFHASLTYFGVYAVVRRFIWRKDDGKNGSHYAEGRLVSSITRRRLAARTGISERTVERALRALEHNRWIKFIDVPGSRRKLLYLGERTANEAGHFTGEHYFADEAIATAVVAEMDIKAGKSTAVAPKFETLVARNSTSKRKRRRKLRLPDTAVGNNPDTAVGNNPDTAVGILADASSLSSNAYDRISPSNIELLKRELLNREPLPSGDSVTDSVTMNSGSLRSPSLDTLDSLRSSRGPLLPPGETENEKHEDSSEGVEKTSSSDSSDAARRDAARQEKPIPAVQRRTVIPPPKPIEYEAPRSRKMRARAAGDPFGSPEGGFTIEPPAMSKAQRAVHERAERLRPAWKVFEAETKLKDPDAFVPAPDKKTVGQIELLLARCGGDLAAFTKVVRIAIWDWTAIQACVRKGLTSSIPRPRIGDVLFLFDDLAAYPNGVSGGQIHRCSAYADRYGGSTPGTPGETAAPGKRRLTLVEVAQIQKEQRALERERKQREGNGA